MTRCLIVGGGVVGLSLAYDLAQHGLHVRVIERGEPGREASWAGAGILPPAPARPLDPLEQLAALSNQLHLEWSRELWEQTHIDNGFRRCGAVYVARSEADAGRLQAFAAECAARGIAVERLDTQALAHWEPALLPGKPPLAACYLPEECQLRNPRHLKALLAGCLRRGVEISRGVAADDFELRGGRVVAVRTSVGTLAADVVCVTTGAWTGPLAARLGLHAAIRPIRGQIALLASSQGIVSRIVNEGSRYLVPRPDGRLLVGSTEEDVGFDRSTTAGGVAGLLEFALGLVPGLAGAQLERSWAGLRPSTVDGLPYLGRVPELENAFIAAGHFRGGLQLSTGTAVAMSQLIRGERPLVDLSPYRVDRPVAASA